MVLMGCIGPVTSILPMMKPDLSSMLHGTQTLPATLQRHFQPLTATSSSRGSQPPPVPLSADALTATLTTVLVSETDAREEEEEEDVVVAPDGLGDAADATFFSRAFRTFTSQTSQTTSRPRQDTRVTSTDEWKQKYDRLLASHRQLRQTLKDMQR